MISGQHEQRLLFCCYQMMFMVPSGMSNKWLLEQFKTLICEYGTNWTIPGDGSEATTHCVYVCMFVRVFAVLFLLHQESWPTVRNHNSNNSHCNHKHFLNGFVRCYT
ncbi:hypothetical protein AMECASPLE_016138 [Ameca splendens]|uniref:Uncharacterized protein n=1 Tax=Ameca splendens TaxID=208324 RepID=A0ABV0Z026_9TELE